MTNEKAIIIFRNTIAIEPDIKEAHRLAISALEKQIPKKVLEITIMGEVLCPACQKWIGHNQVGDYCLHCGQAFDFSEGEET